MREWCIRARQAGLRGFYRAGHGRRSIIIPAARLNKRYFRRWFYWRGISRALLYQRAGLDMEAPEQTTLDFTKVPHVAGVPRYLYRKALATMAAWAGAVYRRDVIAAFEHEVWLWFFAGIVRQRWTDSRAHGPAPMPASAARRSV